MLVFGNCSKLAEIIIIMAKCQKARVVIYVGTLKNDYDYCVPLPVSIFNRAYTQQNVASYSSLL